MEDMGLEWRAYGGLLENIKDITVTGKNQDGSFRKLICEMAE